MKAYLSKSTGNIIYTDDMKCILVLYKSMICTYLLCTIDEAKDADIAFSVRPDIVIRNLEKSNKSNLYITKAVADLYNIPKERFENRDVTICNPNELGCRLIPKKAVRKIIVEDAE